MSATAATVGYGSLLKKATTAISETRKLTNVGPMRDTIEATNLTSPSETKEFIAGMLDSREFTAEIAYLPTDSTHKQLLTDLAAGTVATYTVTLPNGTSIWSVSAFVCDFGFSVEPNAELIATVKFRTTGPWTVPTA